MHARIRMVTVSAIALVISFGPLTSALANGGPFLLKYPDGDPAARGSLARFAPDLKPAREERLRVIKEDLEITFTGRLKREDKAPGPPLALVSAEYTIENPTDEKIDVDFGFPILRGIFVHPLRMAPRPDVQVRLNKSKNLRVQIISNSAIYGIIRQRAREVIEKAIARDPELAKLVASVRTVAFVRGHARRAIDRIVGNDPALAEAAAADPMLDKIVTADPDVLDADRRAARAALAKYVTRSMKWNDRDTALMVEFASLDFGRMSRQPRDRGFSHYSHSMGGEFMNTNLGPLAAIGEQKTTQFFAKLAACFDADVASTYESIFTAWGGDVRERSVDLETGELRPREISIDPDKLANPEPGHLPPPGSDPTIYARVDYFDAKANISEAEKASCQTVLENLPVIFTFAPMNLLHYRVTFEPKSTQTLTVTYKQYAYKDTADPASYQLAYVVHPASLWKDFGPINLEVAVPEGVRFRASVPCNDGGIEERTLRRELSPRGDEEKQRFAIYQAKLTDKTGELFLAVGAGAWEKMHNGRTHQAQVQQQARR